MYIPIPGPYHGEDVCMHVLRCSYDEPASISIYRTVVSTISIAKVANDIQSNLRIADTLGAAMFSVLLNALPRCNIV